MIATNYVNLVILNVVLVKINQTIVYNVLIYKLEIKIIIVSANQVIFR